MKRRNCLIMAAVAGMLAGTLFPARTPAAAADGIYSGRARADVINNRGEHVQEYDVTVELTVRSGVFSEVKTDWIRGESYEANQDFINRVAPVLRDFLLGKPAESSAADDFDAVSGATYTSRAYREAVKNALNAGTGGGTPDADGPGEDTPGGSVPGGDEEKALSITLDPTSLSLAPNAVGSIGYTVSPAGASVTWSSGNPGVAVVEGHAAGAIVTAKAPGTATITATAVSGSRTKTASCTVTVTGEGSDEEFTKGAPKVSVTGKTASSVSISWEAYPGAESYRILRKKTGETFATLAVVGADTTAYTDSTVQPNTNYSYTVEAVRGSLTSKRDTNCLVTTPKADDEKPAATKPAAPKVTLTAGKKCATVKWKKISGANGYVVYRSTKKSKGYKAVKTITKGSTTSWKNTKLKSKKTYYYKVRAYRTVSGKKVYSAYSSVKNVKIK